MGVNWNGKRVLDLGFNRLALMSDMVYVTMEPAPGLSELPPRAFKEMQKMFDEVHGWRLFCQVPLGARQQARWAEFFGFQRVYSELTDRWHYEKDTR